jgi:hypothetical protein
MCVTPSLLVKSQPNLYCRDGRSVVVNIDSGFKSRFTASRIGWLARNRISHAKKEPQNCALHI